MIELRTDLSSSLRQAARRLKRAPGFTIVTVLTLALGIGACTAIYTVVYGVLLQPLPYPEPDRIVHLWQVGARGGHGDFSDPNYEDLRDAARSFAALAEYAEGPVSVVGGSSPVRTRAALVSAKFFDVLGTAPTLGRRFVAGEQQFGGGRAVLVSHSFWERFLGSTRDLAGRPLTFDEHTYTIVGVLPASFAYPAGVDLWVARELEPRTPSRTAHNWSVVGRLAPGVTLAQAQDDVHAIAVRLKAQHGDGTWMSDAAVMPLREALVGKTRPVLLMLLAAVSFLLLAASANVVNLLLARAASRQRESAVRAALGASRPRQALPFLVEASLLAAGGCALGLGLAVIGVRALVALDPAGVPRLDEVRVGWPVVAFACGASTAIALGLGLFTGWRAARVDPQAWLRDAQLTQAGGGSGARARNALAVVQVALSMLLLVGAGLLARSFLRLLEQRPGFRTTQIVTLEVSSPPATDAPAEARLVRFHEELESRTRALPGVIEAGGVDALPMTGSGANGLFIVVDGAPPASIEDFARLAQNTAVTGFAEFRAASDGYFRAMGIPLLRGRWFDQRDARGAPHVAVISESLARTRWPDRDPIGLRIEYGNMDGDLRLITIVGIVGDVRHRGLDAPPQPTFYVNARQRPGKTATFTLAVHGTAEPAWLMARVREIAHALDPDVPPRLRTIEQVFAASLASRRYALWLVACFAAAALALSIVGISGVVSYGVAQRTRELGVRMALGAKPAEVVALVLGHGTRLVGAGLLLGGLGAVAMTRFLGTLLFEITPTDPLTYAAVAGVLALTGLAACQIPALRAARVDPLVALRTDA